MSTPRAVEAEAVPPADAVDAPLRVSWRIVASVWVLLGLFNYSRFMLLGATGDLRRSWTDAWDTLLLSHGVKALLWIGFSPLILAWARRHRPASGNWMRPLAAHLLLASALAGASVSATYQLGLVIRPDGVRFPVYVATFLHADLLFYGMLVLGYYIAEHHVRAARREMRAARLGAELARAQVEALTVRLDPAFVFDVLGVVRSRVRDDPDEADLLVSSFGELLRETTSSMGTAWVTLREELEYLAPYVELARARLDGRLEVMRRVERDAQGVPVPPFVLQPLFEAVLAPYRRPDAPLVPVRARLRGGVDAGQLRLELRCGTEDGTWRPLDAAAAADALQPLRERLDAAYGGRFTLEWTHAPGRGDVVLLVLPTTPPEPVRDEDADAPALAAAGGAR